MLFLMLLLIFGDFGDAHDRMSDLVGIEDVGCQPVAGSVPNTAIRIDASHRAGTGNVKGSASTERSAAVYLDSVPGAIS